MTCEDCLKNELGYCRFYCKNTDKCEDFKDKSEWVHLPCKVGDTVYYVDFYDEDITEIKIGIIDFTQYKDIATIWIDSDGNNFHGILNKAIFLTQEQAEKALAERVKK